MISENANANKEYTRKQILDCLYDRLYTCPCCDSEFSERAVRESKLKLCGQDTDTRSIYEPVDPILYGIICCVNCGYASLALTFDNLPFKKSQLVANYITPRFQHKMFPQIYTRDIGIIRYRAALMTALVTREKTSEIAYIYMKLAWIFRSLGDEESEKKMMLASAEGFLEAMRKEFYPFIDLNEETTLYIVGDFLYRLSKNEQAKLFFDKALNIQAITQKMKSKIEGHPLFKV